MFATMRFYLPTSHSIVFENELGELLVHPGTPEEFCPGHGEDLEQSTSVLQLTATEQKELEQLQQLQLAFEDTDLVVYALADDGFVVGHTNQPYFFVCISKESLQELTTTHIQELSNTAGNTTLDRPFTADLIDGRLIIY